MAAHSEASERPRVCVLDVDAGVDDAQAIVAVVLSPEARAGKLVVAAITCVTGNVPADEVLLNVKAVLAACGPEAEAIPVFAGAARPLVADYEDARYWHGEDGLGGARAKWTPTASAVAVSGTETAPAALWRLAQEHEGRLELLALGPLTNVAVACLLYPRLPRLLRRAVVMGGTSRMTGNLGAALEYNFAADPEAAASALSPQALGGGVGGEALSASDEDAFLSAGRRPVEVVAWEASLDAALPVDWCRGGDWLGAPDSTAAEMLRDASELVLSRLEEGGETTYPCADAVAAAVLLRPEATVTGAVVRAAKVETSPGLCRGALVLDHRPSHVPPGDRAEAGPATGATIDRPGAKAWRPEAGWGVCEVATGLSTAAVQAMLADSVKP